MGLSLAFQAVEPWGRGAQDAKSWDGAPRCPLVS